MLRQRIEQAGGERQKEKDKGTGLSKSDHQ